MGTNDHPDLDWQNDVPVATRFGDPYYSLEDGLAETRWVYLDGNDLFGRFAEGFRIGEIGFGTGLNLMAALLLWRKWGGAGQLRYTSFELHPMAVADMGQALSRWPDLTSVAAPILIALGDGQTRITTPDLDLDIIIGDARKTLPKWDGQADAWFLDGFAPAKNPELWEPDLLAEIARHTAPGGTAATYTAASAVRQGLEAAGFDVERRPGFSRKKHMTVARLR